MDNTHRFIELDLWRGLAVFGMIFYHFFFFLNFFSMVSIPYSSGGWLVFARLIQWSFLLLVGIGIRLSYQKAIEAGQKKAAFLQRNFKRGMAVLFCAMLVSLVTWIVFPEAYIRFGILHLIGVSIILLSFFADRPFVALILSGVLFVGSFWITGQMTSSEWLLPFGLMKPGLETLDYFPILPWMAIPCLGIFLGYLGYAKPRSIFSAEEMGQSIPGMTILWCGRHSLFIYMIHAPILMGIILLLRYLL